MMVALMAASKEHLMVDWMDRQLVVTKAVWWAGSTASWKAAWWAVSRVVKMAEWSEDWTAAAKAGP